MTMVQVLGLKGSGKTTLLRQLVRLHLRRYPGFRAVVWDTTAEWPATFVSDLPHPERVLILSGRDYSAEEAAAAAIEEAREHGGAALVADEIDRAVPNHPGGLPERSALREVVHYGRHCRVALWGAFRRPTSVHQDLLALADVLFIGRMASEGDIDRIRRAVGATTFPKVEVIRALPRGEFLRFDNGFAFDPNNN